MKFLRTFANRGQIKMSDEHTSECIINSWSSAGNLLSYPEKKISKDQNMKLRRYLAVRLYGIWLKDSKSCCCQENKSLFIQSLVPRAINWNTEHQAILVMNDSSIQILNVQLSYGHYSTAAFLAEYVFVCLFFFNANHKIKNETLAGGHSIVIYPSPLL